MQLEELYRRDLNLLIALRILHEEGSVSKAAERLSLSQSAMSRVLGRLRELLEDPLFIRHGNKLLPTERASQINHALSEPLELVQRILETEQFDPRTAPLSFVIATTDYAMQTIFPFALPRIYQEAPHISLQFVPLRSDDLEEQLAQQGCDMAICRPVNLPSELQSLSLGRVGVLCLLSKQHPLVKQTVSLEDYLSYPHALIAISDGVKALLDSQLPQAPKPNIVLRAYHLAAALAMVDKLPLIITVPADLAYLVAAEHNLVIKSLPFDFHPFEYSLVWHPRCELAASQRWMRQLLAEECSRLIQQRIKVMGLT